MINLLPDAQKRQLRAARSNVLLVRYIMALVFVVAFLGIAIFATNFILTSLKKEAEADITANQAKVAGFATVQLQANQFRTSLSRAKTLLDNEIDYSKVIIDTARLLPAGTVLDSLALDQTSFGKPIILSLKVAGQNQAVALRNAFMSSPLYSNVSFGTLSTNSDADANMYPYKLNLNVTLNKAAAQ